MHFYFYARGHYHQVEQWKMLMLNQFFVWRVKDLKTGETVEKLVQGALRPSVLGTWEYVFPEECLAEVLSLMGLDEGAEGWANDYMKKTGIFMLRKALGCEKIPLEEYQKAKELPHSISITGRLRGLSHAITPGVAIHPIGFKRDRRQEVPEWGTEQEML